MYVNNANLIDALLKSHEIGGLTEEAYAMFYSVIKQRIYKLTKHSRDLIEDELEVLCIEKIEKIWQNYRFEQANPFAYFVSIIDNTIKAFFIERMQTISLDRDIEHSI